MKLVNLTPHPITLLPEGGDPIVLLPEPKPARAKTLPVTLPELPGWPGLKVTAHVPTPEVEDLPPRQTGVAYIVSAIAANHDAVQHRTDLYSPDIQVRGTDGQISGAKGLAAGIGIRSRLPGLKPYTVILLYPDYLAETYGEETFMDSADAENATEAVAKVRRQALEANVAYYLDDDEELADNDGSGTDFRVIAVIEGNHNDINPER